MRILSLWQPWASAMAMGFRRIETRSWSTKYRGTVAIHAASKWDNNTKIGLNHFGPELMHFLSKCGYPNTAHPPLGCVVAVGNLIDCLPTADSPASFIGYPYIPVFQVYPKLMTPLEVSLGNYDPERYGWVFADICPLRTPLQNPKEWKRMKDETFCRLVRELR